MAKSLFLGLAPYLESHWSDIHTRCMVYIANQINLALPDDLACRVEEATSVYIDFDDQRTLYPGVRVIESESNPTDDSGKPGARTPTTKPLILQLDESPTKRHLEIAETRDGGRVITVLEMISPGNKVGTASRQAYRQKQRQYLDAELNLVEIDLVRSGEFIVAVPSGASPDPRYSFSLGR